MVTITKDNISQYTNNIHYATKINWHAGELNKEVIDNFPNLQILHCDCNQITTIEPLSNCVNLNKLQCNSNQITSINPLSNCVNLRKLECHNNQITSINPLSNCVNLNKLYCSHNQITSLDPLYNCVNLNKLYCNYNQITSLDPLYNCVNLNELNCWNNQITSFEPLSNCVNLNKLECSNNKITSIEPLSNCVNLNSLRCYYNQITSINPLSNCVNLKELYCYNNQITSINPLSNCVNLRKLYCGSNQITSLDPLSNCVNLNKLSCSHNQITTIEQLSNCVNLKKLFCSRNQITSLYPLIYLRRLKHIDYHGNPIEIPTIQVQRMLNRINTNRDSSIYNDSQNVHDTEIQRTVCDSVQSLLKDPKFNFTIEDLINSSLNKKTIESLIEYCQDETIHSVHLITYLELLSCVWNRIINSIHKTELMRILEEQIADSECKCFTGRFNRTLSVLVGFFDDIKINISDKSRISAIILNSKYKIIPYDPIKHKDAATKELIEAGYVEADFKDWIDAIE